MYIYFFLLEIEHINIYLTYLKNDLLANVSSRPYSSSEHN